MPRQDRGLTLIEILIVMVVLSLLLLTAMPRYAEQVQETYRILARAELRKVVLKQEQFFIEQRTYADRLSALGYPADSYLLARNGEIQSRTGGQGIYRITMEAAGEGYRVRASPLKPDRRCGVLTLDRLGIRGASAPGGVEACW